jgi:NTP pyrophosphatase (non-canonical NTP hydrolase)
LSGLCLSPQFFEPIVAIALICKNFTTPKTPASMSNSDPSSPRPDRSVNLRDFQALIRNMYYEKDLQRGIPGTFMWLMEEIGELASALQSGNDRENLEEEFADVLAWLTTIANVAQIDLAQAIHKKYGQGCPGCNLLVCTCSIEEKP